MIVARGLGRKGAGALGTIVANGLGLRIIIIDETVHPTPGGMYLPPQLQRRRRSRDEWDLLELIPIVVEVLNGER